MTTYQPLKNVFVNKKQRVEANTECANDAVETDTLHIRPAERSDMRHVKRFINSTAEWYREFVDPSDMSEHAVDEQWAKENFELRDFYIGQVAGEPVGTVSLQYFEDYAYLGYVYLDKSQVGKGFGHRLLNHAKAVATAQGMRGMALIAHPAATWARKAYLKYGFKISERQKERILAWQNGALKPHYEQGFELYTYDLRTQ